MLRTPQSRLSEVSSTTTKIVFPRLSFFSHFLRVLVKDPWQMGGLRLLPFSGSSPPCLQCLTRNGRILFIFSSGMSASAHIATKSSTNSSLSSSDFVVASVVTWRDLPAVDLALFLRWTFDFKWSLHGSLQVQSTVCWQNLHNSCCPDS